MWFELPQKLPTLIITPDIPGLDTVAGGDVENEAFNRRLRTRPPSNSGRPHAKVNEAAFARYATAILHPRAAERLMSMFRGPLIAIDNNRMCFMFPARLSAPEIEQAAGALSEFGTLIPRFVWETYGDQTSYSPHGGRPARN